MGYSIFQGTMADMTYPQIEEAIENGACALLPISVAEEHGPHLCTGTDIYLTENVCEKIKADLNSRGKPVLIAPPFYWGVNSITNGFAGSFSIRQELMEHLLLEILENLSRWGIEKIFMLNFHGDFVHIKKIAEIAGKAFNNNKIGAYFINAQSTFDQFGLSEPAPYLIHVPLEQRLLSLMGSDSIDIHAGASETSWMLLHYKELVNINIAKKMKPTNLSIPELQVWLHGGDEARKLTPLGYCGSPADIDIESMKKAEDGIVEAFSSYIFNML